MREDMPIIRVNLSFHNNTDCETFVNIWGYIFIRLQEMNSQENEL